jgi:hypothetical protein
VEQLVGEQTHGVVLLSWSTCADSHVSFSFSSDALCSLETLLKDIVCIQYFRNYLMSINRVEYILAWVEMEVSGSTQSP